MSRREAELLLRLHEGRVCVRYYRRSDGTVVTGDCQSKMSSRVRRRIALTVTLLLSLLTGLFGIALCAQSHGARLVRMRNVFPAPVRDILEWINPSPNIVMGKMSPAGAASDRSGGRRTESG